MGARGIDSDRAFDIPLSDLYFRLRVMFEEGDHQGYATADSGHVIDLNMRRTAHRPPPRLISTAM